MTHIICELGSNPAPAWNFAPFVAAAASAGADSCKCQLFRCTHFPPGEQADKLPLEFPRTRLGEFARACHDEQLQAGASVFDTFAVALAARRCDWLKLAGREADNADLLYAAYEAALDAGKWLYRSIPELLPRHLFTRRTVTTLYAIPRYPTPMGAALYGVARAALFFRAADVEWGWSSHTTGTLDAALAARLGAVVVEKHMDLDGAGVEAAHSLTPAAFARMVSAIRAAERSHA